MFLLFALLLSAAAALPFLTTAKSGQKFFFETSLTSNVTGFAQLFYNSGAGYNEQDSGTYPLAIGTTKVRIPIPQNKYAGLRFDPQNVESEIELRDTRIVTGDGKVLYTFAPGDFQPLNAILSSSIRGDVLSARLGFDANFVFKTRGPIVVASDIPRLRRAIVPFAVALGTLTVLYLISQIAAVVQLGSRGREWARKNPRKAVAVVAVLAVTIQCHPVIFFGKSFVSPDNAVFMLYDSFPVLPGYVSTEVEDAKGSDVGAMMWWHLIVPALQRDALFRDHELPLWNRYAMGGLPLLGQGQSMFGDPLNWLTILADSRAWAWDLRFVIDRWLLAAGIGLTVLILAEEVAPALLITFAAGFLGYFQFRLNHPANFSVCYAPWMLVAWAGLSRAGTLGSQLRYALLLALACFCEMTSGTVKEAYMLVACLNLAGLLLVLFEPTTWAVRARKIALAAGAGVLMLLLVAPILWAFISTMQRSWTIYDQPAAMQISPVFLISFFEDLFQRQSYPGESVSDPATNFIFLAGITWAFVSARVAGDRRALAAIALGSLLPFSLVYGLIPQAWVVQVPFLANIHHVANTFSCSLIVLGGVLAGLGLRALLRDGGKPDWKFLYAQYLAAIGLLLGIYWAGTQHVPKSDFFIGYSWSLVIAVAALPLAVHLAIRRRELALLVAAGAGCVVLMTWRHAQYVATPFDAYVVNPRVRADLHPESPAVKFVDSRMTEPSRPYGTGLNLFAGYNQMLRWESILGVDAMRNRNLHELTDALNLPRVGEADLPTAESDIAGLQRGLDALNVRYYLASHGSSEHEIAGLTRLGSFDLDVFESPTAWPRAFFSDRADTYRDAAELANRIRRGDGRPFVAVQAGDSSVPPAVAALGGINPGRFVNPARDYKLTTNTTRFTVDATGPGIIVLGEGYYPDEFRATVNGAPATYFRANHNSKAIYVPSAGTYEVRFEYWPHHFGFALAAFAVGCLGFVGTAAFSFRR